MNKDALHCVYVDVSSNYSIDWMMYYKHHMSKGDPYCVFVDVYS
jgi:hypothetical protein